MRMRVFSAALVSMISAGAMAVEPPRCLYEVDVSPTIVLDISVTCDPAVRELQHVHRLSRDYVSVTAATRTDERFTARYRVELPAMGRELATADAAVASGESVLAVGAGWLVPPRRPRSGKAVLEVRVATPPDVDFVTAQPMEGGAFRIMQSELPLAGYSAFGRFGRHPMHVHPSDGSGSPASYEVVILDGPLALSERTLLDWIAHVADIMARFWHGFPAPGMKIFVLPRPDVDGVPFGRDMSGGGVSMLLIIGENATREQLYDDWVLIHELVHVGSPFVMGAPWLTEGLATYLEPLIRARYGLQSPTDMWMEFATNMPRGAEVIGASGLARGGFRGWYWGGGLLMLLADVEIRRSTDGRLGLEDCLRAVRAAIGNYLRTISLQEMTKACDAAVDGAPLARLVERHAKSATPVDLDGLWRDLGVRIVDGALELDDDAPLAAVREAIVRGGPAGSSR